MLRSSKSGIIILILMLIVSCNKKKTETKPEQVQENQKDNISSFIGNTSCVFEVRGTSNQGEVPFFTWFNEKNEKITINDYKGKVILLNFWATWCSPCIEEIPDLVRIFHQYKDKGLIVLGISIDQDIQLSELAGFVGENQIDYQVILDDGMLQSAFGDMTAIPTTFIIGKNFKIVNKYVGGLTEENLKKIVEENI